MKIIKHYVIPVLVCLGVGFVSSLVQADAVANWYPLLNKSPLSPPNGVFPVVWTILYILMGISLGMILDTASPRKNTLVALFGVQLVLTFLWCLTFFTLRNPGLGLAVIIALAAVVVLYTGLAYRVRRWSALLFIPYLLWIGFATHLNAYVWMHN